MATTDTTLALPKCWQTLNECLESGIDRVILFGPSGIGKTFAGLTMGEVEAGAHRLVCAEDMTTGDVTGHFLQEENGTFRWMFGAALKAWQGNGVRGGRLVADEIDKAGGDVAATLLAMLDSPESASWEHPNTGQIIKPLDGFSVIMTTNVEDMREQDLKDGDAVVIPPNSYHNIIALGDEDLHLYTVYTPPTHSKNAKQKNKD